MAERRFIFFLDIDGTVYNDGVICRENIEAIRAVRKGGHLVFINTGRAEGIIPAPVKELEVDGFVTSLGSCIRIGDEVIYSNAIPTDELVRIYDYLESRGRKILFEGNDCVVVNKSFYPCAYEAQQVESSADFSEKFGDRVIPKVFVQPVLTEEEAQYFSEKYMFCQHPTYAEISPKGNTKATGMQKVLDFYAPQKYTTVAMGDSLNDIDMLRFADIAVGMGDSHPDILPLCDIVSCPAREGGVAETMLRLTKTGEK